MTKNRFPWVTALLVAPTTAFASFVAAHWSQSRLPLMLILAVPTVVWIGGLLRRAMGVCAIAAALSVVMMLWWCMVAWMLMDLGPALG